MFCFTVEVITATRIINMSSKYACNSQVNSSELQPNVTLNRFETPDELDNVDQLHKGVVKHLSDQDLKRLPNRIVKLEYIIEFYNILI